jgi:cytochrome c-type biogenesis protein CcmH
MTLWFVFALMTAAAIFAVLWPLGRHGQPQQDGSEAVVYKDQLTEIDRDVAAGLIGASEADAARVEISRRLLAAADNQRDPPLVSSVNLRRSAAIIALIGLPIVAVVLYLPLGSPQLGDVVRDPEQAEDAASRIAVDAFRNQVRLLGSILAGRDALRC